MTTGKVAPHEGREIELVLGGAKPLATIEHDKDPEGFVKAILLGLAGMVSYRVSPTADCDAGEVVFALRENWNYVADYEELMELGEARLGVRYHQCMGRLFGYSEADIAAFTAAWEVNALDCNCTKCKGRK